MLAPIDPLHLPRFAGIATFNRLPQTWDADVLVLGIPYDGGTSYRPGSRFGPRAIRNASVLNRSFNPSTQESPFQKLNVADGGDLDTVPIDIHQTMAKVTAQVNKLYSSKKRGLFLGGDHSVTLPILRGVAASRNGKPFRVVHFDAHSDTGDQAWGCPYHHGTGFRRAIEEGLVKGSEILQIGIRGPLTDVTNLDFARQQGINIINHDQFYDQGLAATCQAIKTFTQGHEVYVSLDIDSADPSIAPGTGTPVVGGFQAVELQRMIRSLAAADGLIGADVVEVNPAYDVSELTALLACNLAFELLCRF